MGGTSVPHCAETLLQLVFRARRTEALLQSEADWRTLGLIASRMLFWCGGAIYACRCDGNEMRFALRVAHAPLGAMAHHIAGAYASYLQRSRHLEGSIFKHYTTIPLHDEIYLDDLVIWLHRAEPLRRIWTADGAYVVPNSLPWVDTERVLRALSVGAPGPASYRRRQREGNSPQMIELFTRRTQRALLVREPEEETDLVGAGIGVSRPNLDEIARCVGRICSVSIEDMLADTRKRVVSQARAIATVLATRNGATAAAAARYFNRSRSTLIEQVEYYRAKQPEMFAAAHLRLEELLAETGK